MTGYKRNIRIKKINYLIDCEKTKLAKNDRHNLYQVEVNNNFKLKLRNSLKKIINNKITVY